MAVFLWQPPAHIHRTCRLPGRPDYAIRRKEEIRYYIQLFARQTFKILHRLFRRWHFEQVLVGKFIGLGIAALSHLLRCFFQVVLRAVKFDSLRIEQQPVRAWTISVGHSHASPVEDAHAVYSHLKLHMRMPAHDNLRLDAAEECFEAFLWCFRCKDIHIVARGGMAEKDASQAIDRKRQLPRPLRHEISPGLLQLPGAPANCRTHLLSQYWIKWQAIECCKHIALPIPPNKAHPLAELDQPLQRLPGHGARNYISPNYNQVRLYLFQFRQHCIERWQVPMYIVKRCNPHVYDFLSFSQSLIFYSYTA